LFYRTDDRLIVKGGDPHTGLDRRPGEPVSIFIAPHSSTLT
jgi:hypothetical protein